MHSRPARAHPSRQRAMQGGGSADKGKEGSERWEIPARYLGVLCFRPSYLLVSISRH